MFDFLKRKPKRPDPAPAAGHQRVVAIQPAGRVVDQFVPTDDFPCTATGTQYMKGHTYHVREGNDALAQRVAAWRASGKVT